MIFFMLSSEGLRFLSTKEGTSTANIGTCEATRDRLARRRHRDTKLIEEFLNCTDIVTRLRVTKTTACDKSLGWKKQSGWRRIFCGSVAPVLLSKYCLSVNAKKLLKNWKNQCQSVLISGHFFT